jgi:uncharacterized protein DUF4936
MRGAILYVYYKIDAVQHAALAPRVRAFQASLATAWPGLACELLQRPEAAGGQETWMETYRHGDGLTETIAAAIARAATEAALPMPRHAERFIPLR